MTENTILIFLRENSSAAFGLAGALGGALLSSATGWFGRKRDHDLRLWDKLLERRIRAHEQVISIAQDLRTMLALGGMEPGGEVARTPKLLSSKEEFETWFAGEFLQAGSGSTWLTTEVRRELNFVQDYFVTFQHNLRNAPSEKYRSIGQIIRQDFIDLSSELERKAFEFFELDMFELRLSSLSDWHKYPRIDTEKRLRGTQLMLRLGEIVQLWEASGGRNQSHDQPATR